MAVKNAMFLFEVVVENIKTMVESRVLVIKSDFANIFSLELKDPKQMHIVMPEPLPLPPEPVGKKGKKKKPKPKKPKKGKKGKKEVIVLPPPEPSICVGQSVLFTSTPEILIQNMKKYPLELSLWSKDENLTAIGTTSIHWDPIFLKFLEQIMNCQDPPPVTLKEEYNIFEEGQAKLMAKITIVVKLSHLNEKVTTAFRTLSEDASVRKFLYTGINSKTTSFMCTLKTSDELYVQNSGKIESQYVVDKPKPTKIAFADYKNAPGANLTFFDENDYCCLGHADKPPESKYKSPETCPDIDFIIDYVRKIIVSCNDNMRMLTPRPTISPRVKATDIDRLCYCRETTWPEGALAERFKNEAQVAPCPICTDKRKKPTDVRGGTFDIANIRGPCGTPECKIARELRAYIENLVEEDNVEFNLEDLIGPCGSKDCTLVSKIQDFLRHEGDFSHGATLEGTSTQCACVEKMRQSLTRRTSCDSMCSNDCQNSSDDTTCKGEGCPFTKPEKNVYDVYYFTVEYDFQNTNDKTPENKSTDGSDSEGKSSKSKYKFCGPECPSVKASLTKTSCSKSVCSTDYGQSNDIDTSPCTAPVCPPKIEYPPSPADSNIELEFKEIHNPCCVKSCNVVDRIKEFIADGVRKKQTSEPCAVGDLEGQDLCYCDCVCTFKFSDKTTYCPVCGGYECLGNDMRDQPDYIKPHPCPVYHKLYNKKYIKVPNPWPEDEKKETQSSKSSKGGTRSGEKLGIKGSAEKTGKGVVDKKAVPENKLKKAKESEEDLSPKKEDKKRKKTSKDKLRKKFDKKKGSEAGMPVQVVVKKEEKRFHHYPPVPRNMGWNWVAEDVPGMKVKQGWRPGAISNRLLKKLNKARRQTHPVEKAKPTKKTKKRVIDKPTLIICKRRGEYRVEMQVSPADNEVNMDHCSPLIYRISREDNEERVEKQQRKRHRIMKKAVDKVWEDPYHPEACEKTCLKAYKQAIGLYDSNDECSLSEQEENESCSCCNGEDDDSSDASSLDLEWEIHFSPPIASQS